MTREEHVIRAGISDRLLASILRGLARRVVSTSTTRAPFRAVAKGGSVRFRRNAWTAASGTYGVSFGPRFTERAEIGEVVRESKRWVVRPITRGGLPDGRLPVQITGFTHDDPQSLGYDCSEVLIPEPDGGSIPAWLFPADGDRREWAIHVQGIRTSRLATLRSVAVTRAAGFTSLTIAYRGAGDGPPTSASSLGQREWRAVADAIRFAKERGATRIVLVGWSMGGGIAIETARRLPGVVDRLVLICPVTNWRATIRHGARVARVPPALATAVLRLLSSPAGSRALGLSEPLDFERLDWSRPGALTTPALVIHSSADDEVPFAQSLAFAAAHPQYVSLVETVPSPHGWEANADPNVVTEAITAFLGAGLPQGTRMT